MQLTPLPHCDIRKYIGDLEVISRKTGIMVWRSTSVQ
jgi:hypothetical protein